MKRDLRPAVKLIKEFEGLSLVPYKDSAGIPTIGIGTICYPDGTKVTMADGPITEATAIFYLENHMTKDCEKVEKFLKDYKLEINDNQFCSLVCFVYNVGPGPLINKGKSLHDAMLTKNKFKVAEAMKLYCRATVNGQKVILRGLVRRRLAEAKLYCS